MNLPILILRPADGAVQTMRRASAMGLETIIDPLFEIEPVSWEQPLASNFDALMITSANALKYAGNHILDYQRLPVLAVGAATATAARQLSFQVRETGSGGAQALLNSLKTGQYPRILRLVGEDHVSLTAPDNFIDLRIVYRSVALPIGSKAQEVLAAPCVILLHSVRAAATLARECKRLEIDQSKCKIVTISAQTAEAAGAGWASVHIAEEPTDDALLSLAGGLCQPQS